MKNTKSSARDLARRIKAGFLAGLMAFSTMQPYAIAAKSLDSVVQENAGRVPKQDPQDGSTSNSASERGARITLPSWVPKEPWQTTLTQRLGTPGELIQQQATSAATEAAQAWFKQFGTVKIGISNGSGSGLSGSVDALVPFVDSGENLFYGQFGVRRANTYTDSYRTTVNVGTGVRHFFDNKLMVGGNAFFDRDVTLQHTRVGLGVELWADYLKLSANGYIRASGWKKSPDVSDYLERPANGWDVRAEGFLPVYPQVGGKLIFEQYYGSEVGLFGSSSRQSNPRAVTVGLTYMPFPLVTLEVAHRMGAQGLSDTTARLNLNYALGVPLEKQLRSAGVRERRLLRSSRYDLVERNNEIVLEYKRRELGSIRLPGQVSGYPGTTVSFPVTVETTQPVTIIWQGSAAQFLSPYGGSGDGTLTLPAFSPTGANTYQLHAIASDSEGRQIQSNTMAVVVQPVALQVAPSKTVATADGVDAVQFIATLTGANSEPLVDHAVEWKVPAEATITTSTPATDRAGQAFATVASKRAANIKITVAEKQNGIVANAAATFVSDVTTYHAASLTASPSTGVANNSTPVIVTALVQDRNGNNAGEGIEVQFNTSLGVLAAKSAKTDSSGKASVAIKGPTTVGLANLTAKVATQPDDPGALLALSFMGDSATARIDTLGSSAGSVAANGNSTVTLTAALKDANGNAVGQGIPVHWTTSAGTLAAKSSNTDETGKATIVLTAPVAAGSANVTATGATGDVGKSISVAFVADAATARVSALAASPNSIAAGGAGSSSVAATVKDANGNLVGAGVDVHWKTSAGTIAAVSQTDANGIASATLVSGSAVGVTTVSATASSGDTGKSVEISIVADATNARVTGLTASPKTAIANGASKITLSATVKDRSGNALGAGVPVQWSTDLGTIPAASMTDANGVTSVELTSPVSAGAATVFAKASAGDPGKSVGVTFIADASTALVVAVTATPNTAPANGMAKVTLTAGVKDANGNAVGGGVPVQWSSSTGVLSGASSNTDASGTATIVLTAPTAAGAATVTAKGAASDAGKSATVTFVADSTTATVAALSASMPAIAANGSSSSTITALLKDANGNALGAGVAVSWGTSLGNLSAASSLTDASGQATVKLVSGTVAGLANVTATITGGSKSIPIAFTADQATAVISGLSPTPSTIPANGQSKSTLTAVLADTNGNVLGSGVSVTWTTSAGALSATSSATDASGRATVELTSSSSAGAATISASVGTSTKTTSVMFAADVATAKVVGVTAAPASISANGSSTTVLSATVKDGGGNTVGAGVAVSWATSGGVLAGSSSSTGSNGVATMVLTSATVAETVSVTASTANGGKAANVTFLADSATARVVAVDSTAASVVANGASSTTLTATVQDTNGNAVGAGVPVTWTTNLGALVGNTSITDSAGKAVITLKSGTAAGIATVGAAAVGGGKTTTITFVADATTAVIASVSASASSILADAASTSVITASLTDANGNALGAGVRVSWTTSAGGLSSSTSDTDSAGKAVVTLTSAKSVGVATVTAGVKSATKSTTVAFAADVSTATVVALDAAPLSIAANGTSTSTLTATVKDANGNPVSSGVSVNWTTSFGTLSAASTATDASGKAVVTLKAGTAIGAAIVSAGTVAGSRTATVTFVADTATATVASVGASAGTIFANGSSTATLTATLTDANGNALGAGVPVSWSTSAGTLSASSSNTDSGGKAVVTLTSATVSGGATITATATGGSKSTGVIFVADPGTAVVADVAPGPASILANGASTSVLTATVKDANGNIVGAGVTVSWTTTAGSLSAGTSTTDASGKTVVTLKSATTAGAASVTASAVGGSKSASVSFVPDPASATVSNLDASPISLAANGTSTSALTATVKDANGNTVGAGVTVNWATTAGSLNSGTSTTDASGKAVMTLTSATTAGAASVTAAAVGGSKAISLSFLPDPTTATVAALDISASSLVANGTSTSILTATILDAYGNSVGAGVSVSWSTNLGTLSGSTSATDSSGKASITLRAGTVTGIASINAAAAQGGKSASVSFLADVATAVVTSVVAAPTTLAANGTSTATLTSTVQDANGNSVGAGVAVAWSTTMGSLSAPSSTTDTNGKASVILTSPTSVGTGTVTASTPKGGKSASVSFASDATTATVTALDVSAASIVANGLSTSILTATVKDANGNLAASGTTVNWATTAGTLSSTSSNTDGSGKAVMTLRSDTVAATATITAAAVGGGKSATVLFGADATTAAVTAIEVSAPSIVANGTSTSTLTATVKDTNGNAVGPGVPVTWSTTLGTLAASSSTTDVNGKASVALKAGSTAGVASVSASAATGGKTANVTLLADAATATIASVSASVGTIFANGASTSTITALLTDANGNALGAGVVVTWSTSVGTLSTTTSATDSNGRAVVTLTSATTAGKATVNAGVPSGSKSTVVDFSPDTSTARITGLTSTATSLVANGSSQATFTATVKDANSNVVGAGVPVTFTTTNGRFQGGMSETALTDENGKATVVLTSSTQAGTALVTATTVSAGGYSYSFKFVGDPATARVTSVTSSAPSMFVNGTVVVTAIVKDVYDNLVGQGAEVSWGTTLGTLMIAGKGTTDENGKAVNMLIAPRNSVGTATVSVSATAGSGSTQVDVALDLTKMRVLSVSPSNTSAPADGTSTVTVAVELADDYFNKAPAGLKVAFSDSLGRLVSGTYQTDANGIATATLLAPSTTGMSTVSARNPLNPTDDGHLAVDIDWVPPRISATQLSVAQSIAFPDQNGNPAAFTIRVTNNTQGTLDVISSTLYFGLSALSNMGPQSVAKGDSYGGTYVSMQGGGGVKADKFKILFSNGQTFVYSLDGSGQWME